MSHNLLLLHFILFCPSKIQEANCMGLSLNNSCEADSLSCYYINSLNRTDAVHLIEYQVLQDGGTSQELFGVIISKSN